MSSSSQILPNIGNTRLPRLPRETFYSNNSSETSATSNSNSVSTSRLFLPPLDAQASDRPSTYHSLSSAQLGGIMRDSQNFTTTEGEFEALPLAVQRKYFSTLERLRLAERANTLALDELPIQHPRKSIADRRNASISDLRQQPLSPRRPRKSSSSNTEASWFLNLPPKIKRKNFTAEERIMLDGRLQDKVILDAADEAVYKASRRTRKFDLYEDLSQPPTPMSFSSTEECASPVKDQIYESFRWMDEESDLDLRLVLDDYHANLEGVVIPTPSSISRPSFRRQMSISKVPFGRGSLSSLQYKPSQKAPQRTSSGSTHTRSRTLSLIGSRQNICNSETLIDPGATHYQDPEARLKLRVYLASPQKFDEAIEFGFPSMEGLTNGDGKENRASARISKDYLDMKNSFGTDGGRSFLDDTASLFEDDVSMAEPDSPITPSGYDLNFLRETRPSVSGCGSKSTKYSADYAHLGITKPTVVKQHDNYAQSMAGNREMTLRMTLTRPDLRADEKTIYGWQTNTLLHQPASLVLEDLEEKLEVRGPFGGPDGWGPVEKENNSLKRFWNKVKSSQRKA